MKPAIISIALIAQMFSQVHAARAEPPPCGDPEIMESLHDAAADLLTTTTKPVGNDYVDKLNAILVPKGDFDTRVTEMFTVSNSEATRECQATLHLVEPGRVDGVSPVFYSTVRTDDGKTIFALKEGQPLAATMLRSLEVNNNLTESTDAIRRDLLRSATIKPQIDQFMRANPDFNKPAPSYPHSNFSGNGNRRGGYQGPQ